ncbi:hypothetical protein [Rhodobacter capsulatus]|uniref:hypothetical protein n=1 Tax=Rhodobacter capsulatus TaxID=1061 RepID=UPI00402982DC
MNQIASTANRGRVSMVKEQGRTRRVAPEVAGAARDPVASDQRAASEGVTLYRKFVAEHQGRQIGYPCSSSELLPENGTVTEATI